MIRRLAAWWADCWTGYREARQIGRNLIRRARETIALQRTIDGPLDLDALYEARAVSRSAPDFDLGEVYRAVLKLRRAGLPPWDRAITVIVAHGSEASLESLVAVAVDSHEARKAVEGHAWSGDEPSPGDVGPN